MITPTHAPIPFLPDDISRMAHLAFGTAPNPDVAQSYRNGAVAIFERRMDPPTPEAEALLRRMGDAADQRAADQAAADAAIRIAQNEVWGEFIAKRAAASADPQGRRVVWIRDGRTNDMLKVAIPLEWIVPS